MRLAPIQRLGFLLFGVGFVILFGVVAVVEGVGAPSVPAGDVAVVEGVPGGGEIGLREFHESLVQTIAQGGTTTIPPRGSEAYEDAKATAMERLLKSVWVRGQASESEGHIERTQVRAAIAEFKQQQHYETKAQFSRFLRASKLTRTQFEDLVHLQLLSSLVQEDALAAVPPPSNAQVSDYYEAAKDVQFTTAPTYDIRLLFNTNRSRLANALASLEADDSPVTWKRLAVRSSEDSAGKRKGGLHERVPAEFGEPLDAAIEAAPIGRPQGIVETKNTYFVFQVEAARPARVEPLSQVRSHILSQVSRLDREAALEEFALDFESRWTAQTYCASGYEVQGCANFRSTGQPLNAPSACYEAHPKVGFAAPSCPAVVAQTVPALPGTVTVFNPKGTALPQRPIPAENP